MLSIWARVIHRADYHTVLLKEATRLGVQITLDAKVTKVEPNAGVVTLESGRTVTADVVVGGDGMFLTSPQLRPYPSIVVCLVPDPLM